MKPNVLFIMTDEHRADLMTCAGHDLVPTPNTDRIAVRDPDLEGPPAVYSEYNLRAPDPRYMIRTRRFKYILNQGTMDELYDLEADPGECVNRIDDPALHTVQRELRERLLAWYDPARNPYRGQ